MNTLAKIYIIVTLRIYQTTGFLRLFSSDHLEVWKGKEKHSCSHRMFDGSKEPSKQTSVVQQSLKEKHTCSHSGQDQRIKNQKSKPDSIIHFSRKVRSTPSSKTNQVVADNCLSDRLIDSSSRAIGSDALGSWLRCADGLEGHR
jgi:hypothetical protein